MILISIFSLISGGWKGLNKPTHLTLSYRMGLHRGAEVTVDIWVIELPYGSFVIGYPYRGGGCGGVGVLSPNQHLRLVAAHFWTSPHAVHWHPWERVDPSKGAIPRRKGVQILGNLIGAHFVGHVGMVVLFVCEPLIVGTEYSSQNKNDHNHNKCWNGHPDIQSDNNSYPYQSCNFRLFVIPR